MTTIFAEICGKVMYWRRTSGGTVACTGPRAEDAGDGLAGEGDDVVVGMGDGLECATKAQMVDVPACDQAMSTCSASNNARAGT